LNKKLEFKLKGNFGFYAYTDNPYLFLNKNDNLFFTDIGYNKEKKVPVEFLFSTRYIINNKFTLNINYLYTETFFYFNNTFKLNLKYLF